MNSLKEDLLDTMEAITSAFAGVSREGGISLHETSVLDDGGSDEERAQARTKDIDSKWQDVPDSFIEKPDLSLNFLDWTGFRYYIPAYMMWELRLILDERFVDCNTHGAAVSAFGVSEYKIPQERTISYFEDLFNEPQLRAICKFLQFYATYGSNSFDHTEAQEALDTYWSRWA